MKHLVLAAALMSLFAGPSPAQDAETLLDARRGSRLLDHRLESERRPQIGARPSSEMMLRNFSRQSEARQREWSGAVTPEYRRRTQRDGKAAADAWIRTEAERFDAGEARRLRTLRR